MSPICRRYTHNIGPSSFIMSFLPNFHLFIFRKNGPRSFPLGREPLCRPHGELLGKQACSAKADRRRTTCKDFQNQQGHRLEMSSSQHWSLRFDNVLFARFPLVCFSRKNCLPSFPLGREPLCWHPGKRLCRQICSGKAERRRTPCNTKQDQNGYRFGEDVLTTWLLTFHNAIFGSFSIALVFF